MKILTTILTVTVTCLFLSSYTASKDYLKTCWERQVKPIKGGFLSLHYQEDRNSTYHSPEPWMTLNSQKKGKIYCSREQFMQQDTITGKENKLYISRAQLNKILYLSQPYWNETASATKRQFEHINEFVRYSPLMLIDLLHAQKLKPDMDTDIKYAIYTHAIEGNMVSLFIRRSDGLLEKAVIVENHDILGDVTTTYTYSD
jgi:hypothetical protein